MRQSSNTLRTFLRAVFAAIFAAAALTAPAFPAQKVVLYVATNGNDQWSGRLPEPNREKTDGPYATVQRARDAVRQLRAKEGVKASVTVALRGGVYNLTEPFRLSPEDSGTAQCGVTYSAYAGERPVLSGGRLIAGWVKDKGELWAADVPGVREGKWRFRQLFVNGRRARRARSPNEGYFRVDGLVDAEPRPWNKGLDRFRFKAGDLKAWPNPNDIEVVVFHSWNTSRVRIASVDETARIVTFTGPTIFRPMGWDPNQRYYVENVFEALDSPGEWCLDPQAGKVYYRPLPGEDMARAHVVAPALEQLLLFDGTSAAPVSHVRIRGLSFQHADWTLPEKGYGDPQAAVTIPAVVSWQWALNCSFEQCEIAHIGTYAVWLGRGCKFNLIAQNHLHDLGAGGIRIGEDKMAAEDAAEASQNTIRNNYIHDGGHVYAAGVGVWVAQSGRNTISHNEIHDLDYSGMSIGWNWSDAPNRTKANIVEYNYIHHVLRGALSDGGGIYTLGSQPGAVLRGNVIHDVFAYEQPPLGWGIYLDQDSNGIRIENNLCYNTHSGGIMLGGAHDDVVRNNIFARAASAQVWRPGKKGVVFERNICYLTQGVLFQGGWGADAKSVWDYNLYYRADGEPLLFYEDTFDEWKTRGMDAHSIVADPLFADPAKCNFRLKPESPVFRLGFAPFDFSKAGLEGPPEWIELPRRAVFKPTVLPPAPPPPQPTPVDDGFEDTAVGEPPALAAVSGEDTARGASIRVTDEWAAAGRRSLRISDSPELSHVWEPHFFYRPNFRKGVVRCSFDLRLGNGAALAHEWRDWRRTPYDVGPSLLINEKGDVSAGGRILLTIPAEQWVHFEIVCPLGENVAYDLTVAVPGQAGQAFKGLACGSERFKGVNWLGFTSLASGKAAYWLDNLKAQNR